MENWIEKVVAKWRSEGVKLNPSATVNELNRVESILNFQFPQDFKEFYLVADGFNGLDWQEHMFTLWPLEMIMEEFKTSADKDFIGFCDFLLASNNIGFRKSKEGIYKIYPSINELEKELIAQDFEELVRMINTSSGSIY